MRRKRRSHAVCAGLALRLYLVLKFPVTDSGDAPFYIELAWNWLKNGVYGFRSTGSSRRWTCAFRGIRRFWRLFCVGWAIAARGDAGAGGGGLGTCFLIALIAARLAPENSRRRVALAGLWLAALCPFTANYTAVVLTETLVTFLTALAFWCCSRRILAALRQSRSCCIDSLANPWFLGGIVVGFGTLVRPETPLLLFAAGLVLLAMVAAREIG